MATTIKKIIKTLDGQKGPVSIAGLHGAAKGLVVSEVAGLTPKRTVLVIAPTDERSQEIFDELHTFLPPEDVKRLKIFPESSAFPFSRLSPEAEDWARRMQILDLLIHHEPVIVIAPVTAVMRRTPPKKFISDSKKTLRLKEESDPFELSEYLLSCGYEDVSLVEDLGSFAKRGGILDLWTPTLETPVRIEFDGDKIVSMRMFDPATQRSKKDIFEIALIPARDIPFDKASRDAAAKKIRERAEEMDIAPREWRAVTEALKEGIAFSGIETFMPIFHGRTETIFDCLPDNGIMVIDEDTEIEAAADAHWKEVNELASGTESPERVIKPKEILIEPEELVRRAEAKAGLRLNSFPGGGGKTETLNAATEGNADIRPPLHRWGAGPPLHRWGAGPLVHLPKENEDMLSEVAARIKDWLEKKFKVILACHTVLQAQRLVDIFRPHGIEILQTDAPFGVVLKMQTQAVHLVTGRISGGFRWPEEGLVVITDEELFGRKIPKRTIAPKALEPFTSFAEIADGDHLVHEQHGIGRYRGLVHLKIEDKPGDYLLLEYLGGDKLYLPVYRLNLVGRYIGSGDHPPFLDKLGGMRWSKTQSKVNAAIRLIAKELLAIYAAREVYPGFPFPDAGVSYEEFCAAFPYDETPDQERAIEEIMRDMSLEKPMDRLVCGDVGYGKTEVAMRAALRAALAGKQVAILVPTTVLALQHHNTFTRRFKDTPISIDMLSRFKHPAERREVIENLKRGTLDIVVGTHRLLQKDVRFRDLGLLIVDEEHRFGVRHKERIKKLKSTIDVITMTATPIPRTLNFSLSGIRDISIINTPPVDRHSITTYVVPFDDGVIRQSILRELARGGQVFFVHNRVETIRSMKEKLALLLPEARIAVGHGQMDEDELEKVMIDFVERRADVLLCTTIIESGLDIPTANTIIINGADMMGLAQLYQLRGRVGRSSVRASAYLLTPEDGEMTLTAKKRLTVLKRFTELGSGFQIAMHDLEFRGAGNILGSAQSGHIAAVGYEMYAKLLDREVRKLSGKKVEEEIDPELSLKVAAFLPETYIPDPAARVDIYRRLASRETLGEVDAIGGELSDRFGPLPSEARSLLNLMEVKVLARKLKIKKITFDGRTFACELDEKTPLDPNSIVSLVAEKGSNLRIVPPDRILILAGDAKEDAEVLGAVKNSLSRLLKVC